MRKIGVTPELVNLLNGLPDFSMADLWTFTTNGGSVLLYSGADIPITVPALRNDAKWSEDFTAATAGWTLTAVTVVGNTPGTTDPIGLNTADSVLETTANSTHGVQQSVAATTGVRVTTSFYVKSNGRQWVSIAEGVQVTAQIWFDLTNGVLGTVSGTGSPSGTITALGNGWFRCSMSFTPVASTTVAVRLQSANGNGGGSYVGTATLGFYVWGGQNAPGSAVSLYQKTTAAAVNIAARTFLKGPTFKRENIVHEIGLSSSTLNVTIAYGLTDLVNGIPFAQFVTGLGLDGATMKLERAFLTSFGAVPTGLLVDFAGKVAPIRKIGRTSLQMECADWKVLLNQNVPRGVYQAPCANVVYDADCLLVPATFAVSGAVASGGGGPTTTLFNTNLTAVDDDFALGRIVFTSGPNNGVSRGVKTYKNASGAITLILPLPAAPAVGNTFTIYPGCDLTFNRCNTRFSNSIHFRGEDLIPPVTAAV